MQEEKMRKNKLFYVYEGTLSVIHSNSFCYFPFRDEAPEEA